MRRLLSARATIGVLGCAAMVSGCSAILGDFSIGQPDASADSGPGTTEDSGTMTGDGMVQVDSGNEDSATEDSSAPPEDSGFDAPPDTYQPPIDAGPPGSPGTALTAAGVYATSTHYAVFAAVGESPGGNLTSSSANYELQSGVIGATQ
jgi:hypothetical protein